METIFVILFTVLIVGIPFGLARWFLRALIGLLRLGR